MVLHVERRRKYDDWKQQEAENVGVELRDVNYVMGVKVACFERRDNVLD